MFASPIGKLARLALPVLCLPALLCASQTGAASAQSSRVEAIRYWSFGDVTRIAIETKGEYKLSSDQIENPARVYFDLTGLKPPPTAHHGIQTIAIKDRLVKQIRVAEVNPGRTRIVLDLEGPVAVVSSQLVNPDRLMVEIRPKTASTSNVFLAHSTSGVQKIDLSAPGDSVQAARSTPDVPKPDTSPAASAKPADQKQVEPSRDQVAPPAVGPVSVPPAIHEHTAPVPVTPLPLAGAANSSTKAPLAASGSTEPPPATLIATHETSAAAANAATRDSGAATPAKRDSSGDRSLVRVLGLKLGRVVIDAGHGGHDTGTIGPNGLMEKELVLDVALRLGKLVEQQLGADVVYTRSGDVFIPLEERTRIANKEKADLFISIHANSSPEPSATGVETYFFNLTSDRIGLDLATRENATSASSISDLNDLLHKAVLENKLEESREFAQRVQSSLWVNSTKMNSRSRDRGVRQAPFVVLIGATMPSILAEIGFVSNPHDEKLLRRSDQRQKIAEALFKGVSQYASTLSHPQIARAAGK